MTNLPGIGKTKHKWLLTDLDNVLTQSQGHIERIIAEIRRQQERPGRPEFSELAMLIAVLSQTLSKGKGFVREMRELVDNAPGNLDQAEEIMLLLADLQAQIDVLRRQIEGS